MLYMCVCVCVCVCVCIIFYSLSHYGLLQDIEYNSLCYIVGCCCLFILYIVLCICESQTPNLYPPSFPLW